MVPAQLQSTHILHRPPPQTRKRHAPARSSTLRQRRPISKRIDRRRIDPVIPEVLKVRIQILQKQTRRIAQPVVQRATHPITAAEIPVIPLIVSPRVSRPRLHIVNAAPIPVIRPAQQRAKLLSRPKPLPQRPVKLVLPAPCQNRRIPTRALQINRRPVRCGLRQQIHRAADPIPLHIRLERLVHLHRIHQVRRNNIQLHLPHRLRRRNRHPIQQRVRQPRLRPPHLHILALALIPLQRHIRQPPNRIRHIRIRQTRDHIRRQHINDVVRIKRPADRLLLPTLTRRIHLHTLVRRSHRQRHVLRRGLPPAHRNRLRRILETRIRRAQRVLPAIHTHQRVLPRLRGQRRVIPRRQRHTNALQSRTLRICNGARQRALNGLGLGRGSKCRGSKNNQWTTCSRRHTFPLWSQPAARSTKQHRRKAACPSNPCAA